MSDLQQAADKYIGQLSNGNVAVRRKWDERGGATPDCVVASCKKCGLWDMIVITPNCGPFTNDAVDEFCKRHRHEPVRVPISEPKSIRFVPVDGNYRKFREE